MSPPHDGLDPLACAAFLMAAFVLAGLVQVAWLRSPLSLWFRSPIDNGRTLRGRRLFGDNKTWCGFVVMVPAVGAICLLMALARDLLPAGWSRGLWPLSAPAYGLLGCWLGLGFMAGELPNSFLKRQLGIAPGAAPLNALGRRLCFLLDRLDSIAGALVALALVLPAPPGTCLAVLLIGPGVHWLFSVLLYRLGMKARPA
jgi:CDP-2,3-bis-(O-geranylgeranyl)-sn-glycerol synthase